jgi:phage/plasmid-like protein (TIGR03299 family)
MPAYFDCGFSVREPSWHGLETLLDEYPESWDEARRAAGLMWEPTSAPVWGERHLTLAQIDALPPERVRYLHGLDYMSDGRPDRKFPIMVAETDFQRIVRDDSGETLAVPTDQYSVISHADMGVILEAVLEADTAVKFETAGSVREGRQVWALVRLDEPYTVPGDSTPTYPFLALLNAHDGSASCSLTRTSVRVVCWNTWSAADAQGARTGHRVVFRHTGNVQERIQQAKEGLAALRTSHQEALELFTALAQTPVSDYEVKTFTQLFLPSPRDHGEFCSDRVQGNVDKARGAFTRLYYESETTEGARGSAYGLLMSATEYLDHVRTSRSVDSYVGRTILRPEALKTRALGLIGEVTDFAMAN